MAEAWARRLELEGRVQIPVPANDFSLEKDYDKKDSWSAKKMGNWGPHSVFASHPAAPRSIPGIHKKISEINCLDEKIVDVASLIDSTAA